MTSLLACNSRCSGTISKKKDITRGLYTTRDTGSTASLFRWRSRVSLHKEHHYTSLTPRARPPILPYQSHENVWEQHFNFPARSRLRIRNNIRNKRSSTTSSNALIPCCLGSLLIPVRAHFWNQLMNVFTQVIKPPRLLAKLLNHSNKFL